MPHRYIAVPQLGVTVGVGVLARPQCGRFLGVCTILVVQNHRNEQALEAQPVAVQSVKQAFSGRSDSPFSTI